MGLFVLNWIVMTDSGLDTVIKVAVDADGVESGVTKVKRSLADMGRAASDAGKGTGAIGEGMERSATKVDAATKNMINSLQRQTAAMEAGDKTSRQYQESLARMRGIDVAALKPYLDQLDAAKLKQTDAAKSAESLATGMSAVKIAAVAIGASVGALAMFSKSIIDAADGLNDLSQRVGISVRELGKYQLAAQQSGTSLEAIAKGVKGLAGNMLEHGDALRKAGVDASSADGAMQQLADVFSEMPDGIEKTTLATKLFGKAGMDLIPMLNLGSEGMRDAAIASASYAEQMAIMAPLADSLNDKMAEIALSSKTAGAIMANEFLPSLNKIAQAFVESKDDANSFAGLLGGVVNATIQTAALLISDVVFVLKGMGREIGGIAAQAVALASLDLKGFTAISDAMKADAAKARTELDKFQSDLVKGAAKAGAAVQSAYNSRQGFGEKSGATGSNLLRALGGSDTDTKAAAAAKKALADANKELDEQNKLLAENAGLSSSFYKDWDQWSKMFASGKISLDQLTEAQAKLLAKQPGIAAGLKLEDEALKANSKAREDAIKAQEKQAITAESAIAKQLEANAAIGLSKEALAELEASTMLANAAEIERQANLQDGVMRSPEIIDGLKREAKAMRDLATAKVTGAQKQAGVDAAKDMADEQKKAAEESGKYWEDALMRAFESGKGFFESLWSTIKNTLQTQVLKVLIAPVTGALSGVASAATGSSGVLSGVGSLASMGAQFGSAASITMSNGMISGFGANMTNIAGQLASGSYTSALGMSLPYLGAAVAAFSALKSLGAFGSNFISATDSGRARIDYTAAGIGGNSYNTTGDALQTAAAQKSVETLAQSYFKTAAQLGINAMQATFEFGSNSGREGAAPQTVLGVNIGKAAYSSGEIASGDAAGLQLAASRAIITALKASEMPAYLSKVFDDLTVSTATQDQISSALQYAGSLKSIRDALLETREPLQIVKDNVASAFAALGTSAETFKADFVAAIDAGITTDALSAWQALGVSLDQVTASAKATAEWQNKIDIATGKTTQREIEKAAALANADTATAKLIKEFYALEDAAKAAEDVKTMNAAIADTSNVIRDFYTMLAEKATALKQTLQGWKDTYAPPDPAALAERIADGINNSGATENISATELLNMSVADLNAWAAKVSQLTVPETVTSGILNGDALRGAIANAVAGAYNANIAGFDASATTPGELAKLLAPSIASALKTMGVDNATATGSATSVSGMLESSFASIKAGWSAASGIDTVPEAATDWINKTLGGINDIALTDTVFKPIFDTIQADVNALIAQIQAQENNGAPVTLGIDKAASEKISLQTQLNALTDTSVQALKRQRDALDESNWALFDQVQAAQKAKAVSDEQKSLQDQLNALTDTSTQALTRQRDALDESNRALFDSIQLEKEKQRQVEINNSRLSLQAQIYELTGDKVASLSVREQQRAIELAKLDSALQPLQATLWGLQDAAETASNALAEVTKTLDTAKSEANAAYDALSRAVGAQKSFVQETISNVSSIIDSIDSAVKSLRGDAAGAGTFASAQAFLDNALRNARATGYLPDSKALSGAISDLNRGMADQVYATEADAAFQKLVIAGKLEALGKVAKPQLSAAESQLKMLDATLDTARQQLDALLGVDNGMLSVADALLKLDTSLVTLAAAIAAEKALVTVPTVPGVDDKKWSEGEKGGAGGDHFPDGQPRNYDDIAVATAAINAYAGGSVAVYKQVMAVIGQTAAENLATLSDLAWAAKAAKLPGFKVGTNYVTSDGPAYLHEGEAVIPKAYNPAAGGQQNNNARMESLIEGLTKEVQRLQSIVNDGNRQATRTADATNGRPEQPMLVETV